MHHHAYLWTGPKARFDDEALRRPPHPDAPPPGSRPELIERHRQVAAEFSTSDLPPLETAYWLVKPRTLVRGTWDEAKEAAAWLGERLAEYTPGSHRRPTGTRHAWPGWWRPPPNGCARASTCRTAATSNAPRTSPWPW
ncbi:hypothetical protein SHKM778_27430 [Streptomyces sp. KM77-8]|uniref:Uncharacterized protein n=1 Tax=Streptomyces haneummycinicus TaxID=3074435 RepID=A0AAT9HG05_9ACTN